MGTTEPAIVEDAWGQRHRVTRDAARGGFVGAIEVNGRPMPFWLPETAVRVLAG